MTDIDIVAAVQSHNNDFVISISFLIYTQGEDIELCVSHQGLKSNVTRVQTVVNRYQARAEWLLKGEYIYPWDEASSHSIMYMYIARAL